MEQKNKDFIRRDSATAFLRKHGIDKADYDRYINVFTDQHGSIFNIKVDENGKPLVEVKLDKDYIDSLPKTTLSFPELAKKPVKPIIRSESVAKAAAKKAPVEKVTPVATKTNGEKRTVSSAIRGLIKDGKTNAEIWAIVQPEFNLADNKKHYPAWYRAEVARKNG